MFINFSNLEGTEIALNHNCIWAVTIPPKGEICEILLPGAAQSMKISKQTAQEIIVILGEMDAKSAGSTPN